jgi:hypothetical protein
MRKIDKKLNLQKVNLLTEQRYLISKGIITENAGPTTDIEGVTDSLFKRYLYAIENGEDVAGVDATVYDLMNKTLSGHNASPETKKAMFLTMSEKLKNSNNPKLAMYAQAYNSIGRSFNTDQKMGGL